MDRIELSYRVHKASGMVSVQADCTIDEALALMRDHAETNRPTLDEIAVAVIERRIRFSERAAMSPTDRVADRKDKVVFGSRGGDHHLVVHDASVFGTECFEHGDDIEHRDVVTNPPMGLSLALLQECGQQLLTIGHVKPPNGPPPAMFTSDNSTVCS